mmetsp:Transcript_15648/g.13692  ORF Transcript_15648/g.13692 Transcript_15648/m.13692 type:complete len:219 (+) Transcript_15648:162-818(+)
MDEVNKDFDEEKELKKAKDIFQKKRQLKDLDKVKSKTKSSKLSFLDDEEEEIDIPSKKSKKDISKSKATKSKISLFGNKRFKEKDSSTPEIIIKSQRIMKDPSVNTSFLKDEEKDMVEEIKRKAKVNKLIHKNFETREELIKLKYSYWDGSGVNKEIIVKKGETIRDVIQKCLKRIEKINGSLLGATADTFMMVKADVILPNHLLVLDYLAKQTYHDN